jgi:NAD(P)-dependent dehydrogenase (short-subunit alcohol dehydrogenase family)
VARLDNKVAFITGGESGIGLATARLFAAEGAQVHLAGLHAGRLAEAVAELGEDVAASSVTDVTDEGQVIAAVTQAVDRFGGLDVLFSNAGISGAIAPITEYPTDVFRRPARRRTWPRASSTPGSRWRATPAPTRSPARCCTWPAPTARS